MAVDNENQEVIENEEPVVNEDPTPAPTPSMTVEDYLRSLVFGLDLPMNVIIRSAYSPQEVGLEKLEPSDNAYPDNPPSDFQMRLDYAASTVYYSVLGVFAGGGYSESVGDVRVSKGGYTITMADRARFKMLADALREKWGFIKEADTDNGIYDYTYLRR